MRVVVSFKVNGRDRTAQVEHRPPLLDVIREDLGLLGPRRAAERASVAHVLL